MNWKFWKSKDEPIQQWNKPIGYTLSEEELAFVADALAPAFKRVPDPEPLTDYQKAARLEYRFLQAMANPRKPASALEALGREAMRQNNWLAQQFRMNNTYGIKNDALGQQNVFSACTCLGRGQCLACAIQRENMAAQSGSWY